MKCANCRKGQLKLGSATDRLVVGDYEFKAQVAAMKCSSCGAVFFLGPAQLEFTLHAAAALARAGDSSAESLRFLRKALGMKATDLASLLDVAPETLSRWENGRLSIDKAVIALLGSLVRDRLEGRTDTQDSLRAFHSPRRSRKRITVELEDSSGTLAG